MTKKRIDPLTTAVGGAGLPSPLKGDALMLRKLIIRVDALMSHIEDLRERLTALESEKALHACAINGTQDRVAALEEWVENARTTVPELYELGGIDRGLASQASQAPIEIRVGQVWKSRGGDYWLVKEILPGRVRIECTTTPTELMRPSISDFYSTCTLISEPEPTNQAPGGSDIGAGTNPEAGQVTVPAHEPPRPASPEDWAALEEAQRTAEEARKLRDDIEAKLFAEPRLAREPLAFVASWCSGDASPDVRAVAHLLHDLVKVEPDAWMALRHEARCWDAHDKDKALVLGILSRLAEMGGEHG